MDKKTKINELTKQLMEKEGVKDVVGLQSILKDMLKQGVENLLTSELEEELGYEKYDRDTDKDNYRNGYSKKTVRSDLGEIDLSIPRDRNNEFEPELVPKHGRDISAIEDKVISMYAKGMSTRDISSHIQDLYGIPLSAESVSRMTDKIIPLIEEWQNRPLSDYFTFVFMDAIHYKVKQNNRIISKAAYVVVGIDEDGYKDVLGLWIGENETAKFWLKVLTDMKNRGVQKVSVFSIDGLSGFAEAIKATYPNSIVQRCIIHQIRASARYVGYKHRKEYCKDMKAIYTAANAIISNDEYYEFNYVKGTTIMIDSLNGYTEYDYDSNGCVTRIMDAAGNKASYTYNDNLQVVEAIYDKLIDGRLSATSLVFTYDDDTGKLLAITDQNAEVKLE